MIAAGALGLVASAHCAVPKVFSDVAPVVAAGGGHTAIAWTANGIVQIASQRPEGSFTPAEAVGRSILGYAPRLAISPAGEQVLAWQSGKLVRSAVRPAGRATWTYTTLGTGETPQLVMDRSGRTVAVWTYASGAPDYRYSLFSSTRLPGGSWSAPVLVAPAGAVSGNSTAIDDAGDVVVVYWRFTDTGASSVQAVELPVGAATWSTPVAISAADRFSTGSASVVGGGTRTFVATWRAADPLAVRERPESDIMRTARLRLPGTWEAPRSVLPGDNTSPRAYGVLTLQGVDASGGALATLRYDAAPGGNLQAALRLPASADDWTAPLALDAPAAFALASPPAVALAADGSATVAFLRLSRAVNSLRVVTAQAGSDGWLGLGTDAAALTPCPLVTPGHDVRCPYQLETAPAVAAGGPPSVIAIQDLYGAVAVLTRAAPGARWSAPVAFPAVGRTKAFLRPSSRRAGSVQVVATCTLPPCRGVAVLRMREAPGKIVGRLAFALARTGSATGQITLPRWLRTRLAHGERAWTRLTFALREGDGTSEQTRLPFRLSGASGIVVEEGRR